MIQGSIPIWNPVEIIGMEATLAYNTATSFVSNTNLQHYSGETGLTYFSQLLVIDLCSLYLLLLVLLHCFVV